jgi:hypothetical protein
MHSKLLLWLDLMISFFFNVNFVNFEVASPGFSWAYFYATSKVKGYFLPLSTWDNHGFETELESHRFKVGSARKRPL